MSGYRRYAMMKLTEDEFVEIPLFNHIHDDELQIEFDLALLKEDYEYCDELCLEELSRGFKLDSI